MNTIIKGHASTSSKVSRRLTGTPANSTTAAAAARATPMTGPLFMVITSTPDARPARAEHGPKGLPLVWFQTSRAP